MADRVMSYLGAVLALIMLAACGSANAPTGAAPTVALIASTPASSAATVAPTLAVTQLAATQPAATAGGTQPTAPAGAPAIEQGVTAEGYHTLGRADAPVTLVMYSDFL